MGIIAASVFTVTAACVAATVCYYKMKKRKLQMQEKEENERNNEEMVVNDIYSIYEIQVKSNENLYENCNKVGNRSEGAEGKNTNKEVKTEAVYSNQEPESSAPNNYDSANFYMQAMPQNERTQRTCENSTYEYDYVEPNRVVKILDDS
ncbi:uncharacterized protein LOC142980512 [Anticarsia gemmatalis]|uniref:uncharacterized protein LOC142980512 n=1 Tax=Anticarsia gemmatalis TaxID=129554 RepID=UPI003F75D714